LPSGKFHSAALLCEGSTGGCFAVCLSKDFVSKHRSWFSKSSGGQEQFTVLKLGGKVYIQVPSKGRLDVSEYVDKYGLVI